MKDEKKPATALGQLITFMVVMLPILTVMALIGSHVSFQKRIVAVKTNTAAQELGLLSQDAAPSPFGPSRVWIAKSNDGQFEFRSA